MEFDYLKAARKSSQKSIRENIPNNDDIYEKIKTDMKNTLNGFKDERTKQLETIDNIKSILDRVSGSKESDRTKYYKREVNIDESNNKSNEELYLLKRRLQETEEKLNRKIIENNKLKGEVQSIKQRTINEVVSNIKEKINYTKYNQSINIDELKTIIDNTRNEASILMNTKERDENKYKTFDTLYNRPTDINSSKNFNRNKYMNYQTKIDNKEKRNIEGKIYKNMKNDSIILSPIPSKCTTDIKLQSPKLDLLKSTVNIKKRITTLDTKLNVIENKKSPSIF